MSSEAKIKILNLDMGIFDRWNKLDKSVQLKYIWVIKKFLELKDLLFTGQLRLNFHEGNLSEKVEKKESCKLK